MRNSLTIISVCVLAYGLWAHDWTTIFASTLLAVMWPLIANDLHVRSELDRLWDDDGDLSESC